MIRVVGVGISRWWGFWGICFLIVGVFIIGNLCVLNRCVVGFKKIDWISKKMINYVDYKFDDKVGYFYIDKLK